LNAHPRTTPHSHSEHERLCGQSCSELCPRAQPPFFRSFSFSAGAPLFYHFVSAVRVRARHTCLVYTCGMQPSPELCLSSAAIVRTFASKPNLNRSIRNVCISDLFPSSSNYASFQSRASFTYLNPRPPRAPTTGTAPTNQGSSGVYHTPRDISVAVRGIEATASSSALMI